MPIKGLSDQIRMPRLGKIRLGGKKLNANGVKHPFAAEHFLVPDELKDIVGENPTELEIMFPCEDEDKFASQYYRMYSLSLGLICRGTGETCLRKVDLNTGDFANKDSQHMEWREAKCDGTNCTMYKQKKCKETMFLQFFIPKYTGLGVWQLDTGSKIGMRTVNSIVAMLRLTCGRVSMIPLKLILEPIDVAPDGKKKTVRVLNIKANISLEERARLAAMPVSQVMLSAPIPDPDDHEQPDCVVSTIEDVYDEADLPETPEPKVVSEPISQEEIDDMWSTGSGKLGAQSAADTKPDVTPLNPIPATAVATPPKPTNADFITAVSDISKTLKWSVATLRNFLNSKKADIGLAFLLTSFVGQTIADLVGNFTPSQQAATLKLLGEYKSAAGQ